MKSVSYHITGEYPLRQITAEEGKADYNDCFIVGFQRGFEQLQVAVYGGALAASDAEEAAIEYLRRYQPQALTEAEFEEMEADTITRHAHK